MSSTLLSRSCWITHLLKSLPWKRWKLTSHPSQSGYKYGYPIGYTTCLCSSDSSKSETAQKQAQRKLNLAKPGKARKSSRLEEEITEEPKDSSSDDELDPKLVSTARTVAKSLPGDAQRTESDLLQKLREHAALTSSQREGQPPPATQRAVVDLLKETGGRKKRESKKPEIRHRSKEHPRAKDFLQGEKQPTWNQQKPREKVENIKLFAGPALGIFTAITEKPLDTVEAAGTLFDQIEREHVEQEMTLPPTNAFQEMIHWTQEGKLWKFPVNNEQGLDEEAQVGFHEHVFLDHHLEDFPQKGPVRLFMELVLIGLSKNPYLTVRQKVEHINWFKEYFANKLKLIEELTVTVAKKQI